MSQPDSCIKDSLLRGAAFAMDQAWMDFFAVFLLTLLPGHNKQNATEQFLYAVGSTLFLCAVRDIIQQLWSAGSSSSSTTNEKSVKADGGDQYSGEDSDVLDEFRILRQASKKQRRL